MKTRSFRNLAVSIATLFFAAVAHAEEFDKAALYAHLPKALPFPPGVEFSLSDLKPSIIPGFLTGSLKGRYKGHDQSWPIQISADGRYYILSDVYVLSPSKIPGLLSPKTPGDEPASPAVHVTQDASHYIFGDLQDLSVDPDKVNQGKIKLDGVPYRGGAKASVTIVEYSDMQCPFCRGAHQILEKELGPHYGNKVRWIFKHNPLRIHPWAYPAAIAAACASQMNSNAGWEIEGGLFAEQEKITPQNLRGKVLELAQKTGLDKAAFETCFDKQESRSRVEADQKETVALRLDSTPTFVVNGRIVRGFRDFSELRALIDSMLAGNAKKK